MSFCILCLLIDGIFFLPPLTAGNRFSVGATFSYIAHVGTLLYVVYIHIRLYLKTLTFIPLHIGLGRSWPDLLLRLVGHGAQLGLRLPRRLLRQLCLGTRGRCLTVVHRHGKGG